MTAQKTEALVRCHLFAEAGRIHARCKLDADHTGPCAPGDYVMADERVNRTINQEDYVK